jgi:hypothetical protein
MLRRLTLVLTLTALVALIAAPAVSAAPPAPSTASGSTTQTRRLPRESRSALTGNRPNQSANHGDVGVPGSLPEANRPQAGGKKLKSA